MTYYFLENFEKYFLETLVQIESNSRPIKGEYSKYWLMEDGGDYLITIH